MHKDISVLVELERLKVHSSPSNEENVKILCPFHEDKTPNCNVHLKTGVFRCFAAQCKATGNFVKLYAALSGMTERAAFADLAERYE